MKEISLAVTAYEEKARGGFAWIRECLTPAAEEPMVREIVVTNDGTPDFDDLSAAIVETPKLRLMQNSGRLHVFGNKLESVYQSTGEWVLLCDSDNVMSTDYYRALEGLAPWDPDTWYSASFAKPNFDYRKMTGVWSLQNIGQLIGIPGSSCLMNTGNQFVHRERFLDVFGHLRGKRFDLEQPDYFGAGDREDEKWFLVYGAADSYFLMKSWLIAGGLAHCVPGLEYDHRTFNASEKSLSNYNRAAKEKALLGPIYYLEMLDAARGEKHSYRFAERVNPTELRYSRGDGRSVVVAHCGDVTVE